MGGKTGNTKPDRSKSIPTEQFLGGSEKSATEGDRRQLKFANDATIIGTWNAITLYATVKVYDLIRELDRYCLIS